MTAGVAKRLGIGYEDCKRVNPDVVYCNTWAYGLEGPLAHFGGLDPLYQAAAGLEYEAGPGARRQHAALLPLRDDRHRQRDAVGRRLPRRAVPPAPDRRRPGAVDVAARRRRDVLVRRAARRRRGGPAARASTQGQTGIDALLPPVRDAGRLDPDRGGRRRALGRACAARSACPSSSTTPRFATAAARAEHRQQLEALLAPRFATRTAIVWSRALDDAGVPNEIPIDTKAGEHVLFDADNERLGLVAEYEHPILGRMRQFGDADRLLGDARPRSHGPPPLVGEHTGEILELARLRRRARCDGAQGRRRRATGPTTTSRTIPATV